MIRRSRFSMRAAELGGQIWVAGGLLGPQSATNKTEFYDPTLRTWNTGPPLPFSLNHVMMVPYHNTVWLIGGFMPKNGNVLANVSARVLFLDKAHFRWVYGPSLHHARAAGAAAVVGNNIVVVGGRTGDIIQRSQSRPQRFSTARAGTTPRPFRFRSITWRPHRTGPTCTPSAGTR